MASLPRFVAPMLAVSGRPFDSETHFFEFKWDGYRTGVYVEGGGYRLMSRAGHEVTARYPGLRALGSLPPGLALDGELVALAEGRPDFESLRGGRGSLVFVAFDLLYDAYEPVMALPFSERRRRLESLLAPHAAPDLLLSEGLAASGKRLYEKSGELGLEGVMAKRLESAYASGRRSEAWVKIKRRVEAQVVVIGFIEKGGNDFQSLLVAGTGLPGEGAKAGEAAERLRFRGRVGSGFSEELRGRLNELLRAHPRSSPLVPCPEKGSWIEPRLYCRVSFAELTDRGMLREPVFEALIEG